MVPGLEEAVRNAPLGIVDLPDDIMGKVWFMKYESPDPMVSDTAHTNEWVIQLTAHEKLGLVEDDSCIVTFNGKNVGEVGILPNGESVRGEEIELRESVTNRRIPRFVAWEFRIASFEKTDGLQRRLALHQTHEQQRKTAEASLLDTIGQAFSNMGPVKPAPSPADFEKYFNSLSPEQRQAMLIAHGPDDGAEESNLLATPVGKKR